MGPSAGEADLRADDTEHGATAEWTFDAPSEPDIDGENVATGDLTPVPGVRGAGARFDGVDGRISVADSSFLSAADGMTVSAWVRPEQDRDQTIVSTLHSGGAGGYLLELATDGTAWFQVATDGGVHRVSSTSTLLSEPGNWYHLVGTFDGSQVRVYVDGELQGESAGAAGVRFDFIDLAIGDQMTGGYAFAGVLDEIFLADTALAAADIALLAGALQ